jgi:NADPH:quinone reductase-like Zn-dependent oxidoreductase
MRAVAIDGYGGRERLAVREIERPTPGSGQLLVRVQAASVNPLDWKIRRGELRFVMPQKFPWVPGYDAAGVVEEIGAEVDAFAPGDAVHAMLPKGGACAEFAVVDASAAAMVPDGTSFEEAAAVPVAGLTAWQALVDRGELVAGEKVLVNGGAGGVGHFAVQIAAALGAHVTAVASGRNQEFLRQLGAERTIDYEDDDFTRDEETYDVVFDAAGTSDFRRCDLILGEGGIYVTTNIGPRIFVHSLFTAIGGLFGPARRARPITVKPNGQNLAEIDTLILRGKLRPHVDRVFPLDDIRQAHEASESGHVRGKIVVRVQPPALRGSGGE